MSGNLGHSPPPPPPACADSTGCGMRGGSRQQAYNLRGGGRRRRRRWPVACTRHFSLHTCLIIVSRHVWNSMAAGISFPVAPDQSMALGENRPDRGHTWDLMMTWPNRRRGGSWRHYSQPMQNSSAGPFLEPFRIQTWMDW